MASIYALPSTPVYHIVTNRIGPLSASLIRWKKFCKAYHSENKQDERFFVYSGWPFWEQGVQNNRTVFLHERYPNVQQPRTLSQVHWPFASSHYPSDNSTILLEDLHYSASRANQSCVLLCLQTILLCNHQRPSTQKNADLLKYRKTIDLCAVHKRPEIPVHYNPLRIISDKESLPLRMFWNVSFISSTA